MAKPLTVLVVDDEPPIRRFLRTSLTADDYRVVEAEDAAERDADASRPKSPIW